MSIGYQKAWYSTLYTVRKEGRGMALGSRVVSIRIPLLHHVPSLFTMSECAVVAYPF